MDISSNLTAKQLQDILVSIYNKGQETKDVQAMDLINEMKQTILTVYSSADNKRKLGGR